jgi:hypothetical protein
MAIHGGLSPAIHYIDQIRMIHRVMEIPSDGPFAGTNHGLLRAIELSGCMHMAEGYSIHEAKAGQFLKQMNDVYIYIYMCVYISN